MGNFHQGNSRLNRQYKELGVQKDVSRASRTTGLLTNREVVDCATGVGLSPAVAVAYSCRPKVNSLLFGVDNPRGQLVGSSDGILLNGRPVAIIAPVLPQPKSRDETVWIVYNPDAAHHLVKSELRRLAELYQGGWPQFESSVKTAE